MSLSSFDMRLIQPLLITNLAVSHCFSTKTWCGPQVMKHGHWHQLSNFTVTSFFFFFFFFISSVASEIDFQSLFCSFCSLFSSLCFFTWHSVESVPLAAWVIAVLCVCLCRKDSQRLGEKVCVSSCCWVLSFRCLFLRYTSTRTKIDDHACLLATLTALLDSGQLSSWNLVTRHTLPSNVSWKSIANLSLDKPSPAETSSFFFCPCVGQWANQHPTAIVNGCTNP